MVRLGTLKWEITKIEIQLPIFKVHHEDLSSPNRITANLLFEMGNSLQKNN